MRLNEFQSKQLLKEYGINIPKGEIAKIGNLPDDIYRIRDEINSDQYVLKIVSEDIVHKSDAGGVILNVSYNQVMFKCGKMLNNIINKFPKAKIDGIYIQSMINISNEIEILIGIKEDSQFGKVIVVGMGGIYTEIFKDVSMRVLPITKEDAQEMITETKVYKILNGARGKKYDIDGISDTLIKVSLLTDKYNIKEMDINPLVVREKGVVALDARIMM